MTDKATPVRVGITLTGPAYRNLCTEVSYHEQTLLNAWRAISGGPDKDAAKKRLERWRSTSEQILGGS